jgi:hypothetical protein
MVVVVEVVRVGTHPILHMTLQRLVAPVAVRDKDTQIVQVKAGPQGQVIKATQVVTRSQFPATHTDRVVAVVRVKPERTELLLVEVRAVTVLHRP